MNLDLSLYGWFHTGASLLALLVGGVLLLDVKGTARHRRNGFAFVALFVATNVSALLIYRRHIFWFPHWLALAGLGLVLLGVMCARYRWPRSLWRPTHMTVMLLSCYLLIGGGVNEIFLRVDALHALAPNIASSRMVGLTHFTVMGLFLLLILYFNIRYRTRRGA
jgi:uncharacterized membrane protein